MTPKVYLFLGMEFDNFCFVFNVLWVREFIAATAKSVTFTDDLEIQGHMLFYVTIPSSVRNKNLDYCRCTHRILHVFPSLHREDKQCS